MNEEGYIRNRIGNANPFRVPDGYFDSFTSQMMDRLPEREAVVMPLRRSRLARLRSVICAAACLCIALFSMIVYLNKPQAGSGQHSVLDAMASNSQLFSNSDYEEEYVDYVMMDNADIYAYLSGE